MRPRPWVVKTKIALKSGRFFQFSAVCLQFLAVCLQFPKKNLPPLKHILVFTTYGLGSIIMELQPFEIATFDLGHPVLFGYPYIWVTVIFPTHQSISKFQGLKNVLS